MRTLSFAVPPRCEGQTVYRLLRGELQLSYTLIKSLKWRDGAILLNGSPVHVNAVARAGDELCVALAERRAPSDAVTPCALPLDIVYEDEDLLVVNKSAGIAMHPKSGDPASLSMAGALKAYLGADSTAHFVSRLDKGTSGLFIAAKTGHAHNLLRLALHSAALRREYRAVAVGHVTPESGTVDLPIARAEGSIVRRCVAPDGLPSRTEYESLAHTDRFTLLRLAPLTGRTHQLRVHMSALGYPLAGDWLYGTEDRALIARPALHSYELWFRQPITGKELHFTAPVPTDMLRLMENGES